MNKVEVKVEVLLRAYLFTSEKRETNARYAGYNSTTEHD